MAFSNRVTKKCLRTHTAHVPDLLHKRAHPGTTNSGGGGGGSPGCPASMCGGTNDGAIAAAGSIPAGRGIGGNGGKPPVPPRSANAAEATC